MAIRYRRGARVRGGVALLRAAISVGKADLSEALEGAAENSAVDSSGVVARRIPVAGIGLPARVHSRVGTATVGRRRSVVIASASGSGDGRPEGCDGKNQPRTLLH
jgi:hypothetical protein